MGWRNSNIFAWSPQDVATFLDEIGLAGLKSAVLQKSITGPQLISMSPEEMSDQLGATSVQARKIHSELNGLGSSSDLGAAAIASAKATASGKGNTTTLPTNAIDLEAAQEAAAYNTAGTTGAFIDPRNPNQSLQDYYNSNQSLSGFQIGGAAAAGAAVGAGTAAAIYSPMGAAVVYPPQSPTGATLIQQQQQQQLGGTSPYDNNSRPPVGVMPLATAHQLQDSQQLPITSTSPTTNIFSHLKLCRSFYIGWLILLIPLLMVAMADLGFSIYMNGKFTDARLSPFSEWGYIRSEGVFSPHYMNADMFWCILFFVAQGYTILISIILLAFLSTLGRKGTLSGVKNLIFGTVLLSFLGLALYTVPIVKWTYVIVTDYDIGDVFNNDAIIPAVAFVLEWLAVLLWLVCLVLAAVQLARLRNKKYIQTEAFKR